MTSKPDTQISNDPVRAVLGADRDLGLWWISEGLDVSSNLLGPVQNLIVGECLDFIPAHGLGQENPVAVLLDVGKEVVDDGLGIFGHNWS